jgi:hypothetical protein
MIDDGPTIGKTIDTIETILAVPAALSPCYDAPNQESRSLMMTIREVLDLASSCWMEEALKLPLKTGCEW